MCSNTFQCAVINSNVQFLLPMCSATFQCAVTPSNVQCRLDAAGIPQILPSPVQKVRLEHLCWTPHSFHLQ